MNQAIRSHGRDLKPGAPDYGTALLPTVQRFLVNSGAVHPLPLDLHLVFHAVSLLRGLYS
jgi:hypothetical protein